MSLILHANSKHYLDSKHASSRYDDTDGARVLGNLDLDKIFRVVRRIFSVSF